MYEPPLYEQTTNFTYSVTFFWLKWLPIHQLTQYLCYNIPFHLYIHDQGLQQTLRTITCGVNMYEPPYMNKQLYFTYLVTFFLAQTDTNPPTNSKSVL